MPAAVRTQLQAAALVLAETLWPTRCCVCDVEGAVLCERCRAALPYVDQWLACPRCGAPWGRRQCTECNRQSLADAGLDALPHDGCVSAVHFGAAAGRIVRTRKDAGERRLARDMAFHIACAVPPAWLPGAVVAYVPSTRAARARRGFCHARELAEAVAGLLGLPVCSLLLAPRTRDQRELARAQRFANMRGALHADGDACDRALAQGTGSVIVVDDVLTTGATLYAAAHALRQAGFAQVHLATFARVY